jgi:hypothetical protein
MSVKGRERKRKKRIAAERASRESRQSGSSSQNWYLTLATRPIGCARCPKVLRVGHELVYRAQPREALCVHCTELAGIKPRLSWRWENARGRRGR